MALFDVPGWSMPAEVKPVVDGKSRKRKRSSGEADDASSKLYTAEVNVEKLMEKLADPNQTSSSAKRKKHDEKADRKNKPKALVDQSEHSNQHGHTSSSTSERKRNKPKKKGKNKTSPSRDAQPTSTDPGGPSLIHPRTGETRMKGQKDEPHEPNEVLSEPTRSRKGGSSDAPLTNLQSKMKQSLDGARFRWINEMLYKSNSQEAERLIHEDPKVFDEYHTGFRHQVTSWPTNPVDHFIRVLSSYPQRSVIVDLGCGDAVLAQKLVPKGHSVLSFDLISTNPFIVAADICGRLPLPGSENEDEGQVVDVVVCCLSLMNTNWLNCIREARRILKRGGELKIAEVASRFTNVDKFTSVICSIGFRLASKDERNSHFTTFDFKKAEGSRKIDDKLWQKVLARGDVLQPCEYKRR